MNKKGFTLIELLAVIVILAIIALIAVPSVLNIIEDSKKGAAEASARNIVSAAKTYYMQSTMNGGTVESIDLSTDTLKYDGEQANKGSIIFTNGKASGKLYVSGYCVEISIDGKVESEKTTEEECKVEELEEVNPTPDPKPTPEPIYRKYNNGDYVLFDPVNNIKCETSIGSDLGMNDGCMKWYIFLDSENSSTLNLILDHNILDFSAWGNSGDTTPTVIIEKLQKNVKNWNDTVKNTARLISAVEVNQIAPEAEDYTWVQNSTKTPYKFYTGNQTLYEGAAGTNPYYWLFDNTSSCETFGCSSESSGTGGYWTSSHASGNYGWVVGNEGGLRIASILSSKDSGIRPVIEVAKSIFE